MILLGSWQLKDFAPGEGFASGAWGGSQGGWLPVAAPGDTYLALVAAGHLPHPFEGQSEIEADWVRHREWWWRTSFEAPPVDGGQIAELVFEGLDTFATVYLDGQELGRTDNMFRRHVFDVSDGLVPGGRHDLAVCFHPTASCAPDPTLPVWGAFTDRVSRSRRNLIRKAQFGWGWDWGPDLPTVGIWKAVHLDVRPCDRILDLRFTTRTLSPSAAEVGLEIALIGTRPTSTVEVTLRDPEGTVAFCEIVPANHRIELTAWLENPQLWWTADLGDQPLYQLTVRLMDADRVIDEAHREVGLRTISLDQSPDPDEPGTTFFRFILNGVSLFAKGACWVPPSSFVAEVEDAAYARLIDQAVQAHMNMIRVWGGGVYEPDVFYTLCDRRGLLVWQDFMFACAHYPEDATFMASVRAEVEDQVLRLRNHACLALWCGNNESQAMHRINADISGDDTPLSGLTLYDDLIPRLLETLDPETPYWPGSPWGGPNPNSMRAGDVHDWTVWHGVPPIPDAQMTEAFASSPEGVAYVRYAEDTARFVSEFGIQGAPALETLRRWMDPADLHPESPGFLARIKDEARKADAMMATVTGSPETIQDYVDFTQWTQAEGLKFGIEHFRRRRPHCSGALVWQFNDCWPCVSWSLVDYDGVEKAAYHAVRRAFAPVLASFKETGQGELELWITNDTAASIQGEAQLALESLDGALRERWSVAFSVPPSGHAVAWRGSPAGAADLVLRAWTEAGCFAPARYFFVPIRDLALEADGPGVVLVRLSDWTIRVDLAAPTYLAFVHLVSSRPDLRYSDNHFDMARGERRSVMVTGSAAIGPHDFEVTCWNTRSHTVMALPPADGFPGPTAKQH